MRATVPMSATDESKRASPAKPHMSSRVSGCRFQGSRVILPDTRASLNLCALSAASAALYRQNISLYAGSARAFQRPRATIAADARCGGFSACHGGERVAQPLALLAREMRAEAAQQRGRAQHHLRVREHGGCGGTGLRVERRAQRRADLDRAHVALGRALAAPGDAGELVADDEMLALLGDPFVAEHRRREHEAEPETEREEHRRQRE